jgi:tetratricopeptide (TPR) repeat protein
MTMERNDYQRGLELAEAGNYQQALEWIQRHLQTSPNDAEALNDAGAILHCLGRSDEAVDYFTKAKKLHGNPAEILWNLCEAYLAVGRTKEIVSLFDEIKEVGIFNVDILNRTATAFLNQGDKANAIEMLIRSLDVWPDQEVLKPMLTVIHSKRPKIAFFCGGDGQTFLMDIIEFTKKRFEVRVFDGKTEDDLYELMQWSDISWFEWCTNLAVIGSNKPKVCKTIVRLHRYEAYESWPHQVNWDNVDVLITVGNSAAKETLLKKVPALESRTSRVTIPNGVDLNKFKFVDRKRGKNIAFLANLRMVKNPGFALQCMQKLHYIDREYKLFFGGEFQDEVVEQYLKHMVHALDISDVVFFDGWQEDVNSWLQDKHYIVSTSICEGHPVGILEAMACGLKPVIHNFLGANSVFPSEFLFNISEEFCEKILSDSYLPGKYRKFVEEKCSLKSQLSRINSIFTQFEAQIDSKRGIIVKPQCEIAAAVI